MDVPLPISVRFQNSSYLCCKTFCLVSSTDQVPSPYTGKSMQNPAPAAALSAAQHALDAARQQTHVSSGGGKSMAQLPPSTLSHQMPSSMGKPQQMPLNPGNNRMPQQLTPQSMSSAQGMQPNNAQVGQKCWFIIQIVHPYFIIEMFCVVQKQMPGRCSFQVCIRINWGKLRFRYATSLV